MYFETTIIRDNRQIADFEFSPNEELNLYLRSHDRIIGDDSWFCISDLTKKDIAEIQNLCERKDEKELFEGLKEGDSIDILLHFCVYIKK